MKKSHTLKLYNRVTAVRMSRDLSVSDLAKLVGSTKTTIIAIENNTYTPTVYLSICLAIALETTVEDLFYLEIE